MPEVDDTELPADGATDGEEEDDQGQDSAYTKAVGQVQDAVFGFFTDNSDLLWKVFYVVLLLLYLAYFIAAMVYE